MKSNLKSSPPNSIIHVVLDQLSLMQRPVHVRYTTSACSDFHFVANKYYALVATHRK
jgi:hypothetical protein